ncbi:MAG: 50S ribosomal protein L15 [Candidatus Aenigmarchaeota archaeon]|nr:50S ribosomal protein L15 [Candidatus Aenigmarchaeota archaeon]
MVVRKRKKHSRFRGNRHYHGSHKNWKGGGNRGGRGQAGMHKHKWTFTVKYDPDHYGKHGFTRHAQVKEIKAINLKDLDRIIDRLVAQKLAGEENGKVKINLPKIGYDKLLGSGNVTRPLIVEAKQFSKNAVAKLEKAGGKSVKL